MKMKNKLKSTVNDLDKCDILIQWNIHYINKQTLL